MSNFDVVIGLEVHVQIKTKSKMFCSCPTSFGEEPNTSVCPVCTGYPGVMPVPNHEAIRKTIIAGFMCDCKISELSKFDRKSYFYPDMPKNYQITQYDLPFCKEGKIHIYGKGFSGEVMEEKYINMTRIHLEEDVAKSVHYSTFSGIDYNRAGVPLMEIVSEPEISSADEAYAYLTTLKQIMQYAGISDCDMEKGQMRCDLNISLKPSGQKELGTKIELKNLNSFRAVHRAINSEIERQKDILLSGGKLQQETRGWNDDNGSSYLMRVKESAHDYRYFPEPDLTPIRFSKEDIEKLKSELPELPETKTKRFVQDYGLTEYDADVITAEKSLADYFDIGAKKTKAPKILANWIISELLRELADANIPVSEVKITPESMANLIEMISSNAINGKIAKSVFVEMFETGKAPQEIVKERGLVQVSDESEIEGFVIKAIEENPAQIEQYKSGKTAVLQYFVGQVMKFSKGKANPQGVQKILKSKLDA